MALSELQLRNRILEEIWDICPTAKKIRRNPFTSDRSKWAGHFTHEVDSQLVTLAFIVRRTGYKAQTRTRTLEQHTFEILGFYGYNTFIEAEERLSSEDVWQGILDEIGKRLADLDTENPVWEFENEEDEAITDDIEFRTIGLIEAGGLLHFAGGIMTVSVHRC